MIKTDWRKPLLPAMCIVQAIFIVHHRKESFLQTVAGTLIAMLLCYVACLRLTHQKPIC